MLQLVSDFVSLVFFEEELLVEFGDLVVALLELIVLFLLFHEGELLVDGVAVGVDLEGGFGVLRFGWGVEGRVGSVVSPGDI